MIDFLAALLLDFLIGDPYILPHPVKFMGRIISFEEKTARRFSRGSGSLGSLRTWGACMVLINIIASFLVPYYILKLLKGYGLIYHIINTYFLYTCIAAGCLQRESMKVYKAFTKGIDNTRHALSFIVGRETTHLDEKEIIRATVETVAENTSDGVIAPMMYAMIGGASLAFVYKMVNTMDSMLGYLNEKYKDIGFYPAKTDDLLNFLPARITGVLMCISSVFKFNVSQGFKIMIRDRRNHKSPNCAYPEGAVAGLLGVQLGGDNTYFGEVVKKPKIGDSIRELEKNDIKRSADIMYRTEIIFAAIYFILLWVIS